MRKIFVKGAWCLRDLKDTYNLYTRIPCDVIRHKATGKEYALGPRRNYYKAEDFPALIEDTNEYEFIRINKGEKRVMTTEDFARELMIGTLLKK